MKILNNERGGALVMALLIMLVFTVLGMSVLAMNINATKQFGLTEKQVQARHQAEMGVIHHKAAITDAVKEVNSNPGDYLTENDGRIAYRDALCEKINNIRSVKVDDSHYETYIRDMDCTNDAEITADIASIGTSEDITKEIDATIVISSSGEDAGQPEPPLGGDEESQEGEEDSVGGPPKKPVPPPNEKVRTEWPCQNKHCGNEIIEEFTTIENVDDSELQKGDLLFKNHLVVEKNFNIKGGKGLELTVAGDFYITKKLHVQNHACIYVNGHFTVGDSINLLNKGYIFVQGDANLPKTIDMHKNNAGIYVSGDVYVNGNTNKENPKPYQDIPTNGIDGCKFPEDITYPPIEEPSPPTDQTPPPSYDWEVEDSVNAIYK